MLGLTLAASSGLSCSYIISDGYCHLRFYHNEGAKVDKNITIQKKVLRFGKRSSSE